MTIWGQGSIDRALSLYRAPRTMQKRATELTHLYLSHEIDIIDPCLISFKASPILNETVGAGGRSQIASSKSSGGVSADI